MMEGYVVTGGINDLAAALRVRIERALAGYKVRGRAVNVVDSYLPARRGTTYGGPPQSEHVNDDERFPFVIVFPRQGTHQRGAVAEHDVACRLDLGIQDLDESRGLRALRALIDRLIAAFYRDPQIGGPYTIALGKAIVWNIYDKQTTGFLQGFIEITIARDAPRVNFEEVYYGTERKHGQSP